MILSGIDGDDRMEFCGADFDGETPGCWPVQAEN